MHTAILKLERASVEEVANGSGRQDLIGLSEGEDTSGGMDREAANIAGGYLDLATVDRLSEFEAESSDLRAQQDRTACRFFRTIEYGQHPVAGPLHHATAMAIDCGLRFLVVLSDKLLPRAVPDPVRHRGGVNDVGE